MRFDAENPVTTQNTLNDEDPVVVEAVEQALGDGVDFMVDGGIPLERIWGEVQFRPVGPGEDIPTGNSYIQTVTWDETECPDAFAVLTYSQSTNPASDHYADLTQVYSDKGWNDMPYCDADIQAAKIDELDLSNLEN